MTITISDQFDGGNIRALNLEDAQNIQLEIKKDHQSQFFQWFYFQLNTKAGTKHHLKIMNAHKSSYPPGWNDYRAVCSYDRKNWFRVTSEYNGKELVISHSPKENMAYYAYFTPFSHERHLDLIAHSQCSPLVKVEHLGETLDGRPMTVLHIGEECPQKKHIWIIARQHPGETMAQWFIEGLLERLLEKFDSLAKTCLKDAIFHLVPNMNPDGAFRGHLRTNAAGTNLNREWQTPTLQKSPEVYLVKNSMAKIGCDLFLDIHGDENLPYNFLAGSEGSPSYNKTIQSLEELFKNSFLAASPDFQTEYGYEKDAPGQANMTISANAIAEQFHCLSYILEMPFKDNAQLPCQEFGWSSERSKLLAREILHPIASVLKKLDKS